MPAGYFLRYRSKSKQNSPLFKRGLWDGHYFNVAFYVWLLFLFNESDLVKLLLQTRYIICVKTNNGIMLGCSLEQPRRAFQNKRLKQFTSFWLERRYEIDLGEGGITVRYLHMGLLISSILGLTTRKTVKACGPLVGNLITLIGWNALTCTTASLIHIVNYTWMFVSFAN